MTYLDLNLRLPELLLMRVDKMSMGVSPRGPRAVPRPQVRRAGDEHPDGGEAEDGELKHILKKAVRGVIPDEIIDRPKQGFGVPVYEWFFDRVGELAARKLQRMCAETDLFEWAALERLLRGDKRSMAWPLLNLAMWWETFIAGDADSHRKGTRT